MSYSLSPHIFTTSFFFYQFVHHNYLTRTSKLFQPVHLPTPNCNQRLHPFHCLSSSLKKSTYLANCPYPIVLTQSSDRTSDYVFCWSIPLIPIDTQIHSVNLHYLIVPHSLVFNFAHVLYEIFIFFNSLHCK